MGVATGEFAAFALDCLEAAVFVVDSDTHIKFASAAAQRLLKENRLRLRNGKLCSPFDGETTALRRLVQQCVDATASGPTQMTFHRLGDDENVLCLAVVAARRSLERQPERPFVLMFATRLSGHALPETRQLRSHFGLTPAQARLAIEITKGEGLKACTERLGISMTTGRSHLRKVFEKTETRRQAELVRLISALRFGQPCEIRTVQAPLMKAAAPTGAS
jgi:DNA-binding CsgD family transcriptional regulator